MFSSLTPVGFISKWLDFFLQLFSVEHNVWGVEFVSNLIASEVINHALSFFRVVWILVLQYCVNCWINAIVDCVFDDVALNEGNWADDEKRNQSEFAENADEEETSLLANTALCYANFLLFLFDDESQQQQFEWESESSNCGQSLIS